MQNLKSENIKNLNFYSLLVYSFKKKTKELSHGHKLKFSNPNNSAI